MNVWHIFLADIFQSSSLSFDFIRSFLFNFLDGIFEDIYICDHIFLFGRVYWIKIISLNMPNMSKLSLHLKETSETSTFVALYGLAK